MPELRRSLGLGFVIYALVVYPIVGHFAGHLYPATPTFGAPCPLTIFTIGLLLMTTRPLPFLPAMVPLLWSFFGVPAVFKFGMLEDPGLPIAGPTLVAFMIADRLEHLQRPAMHWS